MLLLFVLMAPLWQEAPRAGAPAVRAGQDAVLVAEEVFQATVVSIEDGDTLIVRTLANAESMRVHVAGVDAPEMSQPGGPEAKAFLATLVSGKTITVRLRGTLDSLAHVQVDGVDLAMPLIRNGMAWHCPRFAKESGLAEAEAEYRRAREFLALDDRRNQAALAYNVGQCLWLRGELEGATSEFRKCLAMDPADSYRGEAERRLAEIATGPGITY